MKTGYFYRILNGKLGETKQKVKKLKLILANLT